MKGFFESLSVGNARPNCGKLHSTLGLDHCLSDGYQFSSKFVMLAASSVIGLFLWRSPDAIIWAIVKGIIYPFYRVSWAWSAAHIGKKVKELTPPLANLYAATTIEWIRSVFWVTTSVTHICPNTKFRSISHSMNGRPCFCHLCAEAPARLGMSLTKAGRCHASNVSAVALANPKSFFVTGGDKATEPFIGYFRSLTKASTAFGKATFNIVQKYCGFLATIASKRPSCLSWSQRSCFLNRYQASESLSCNIFMHEKRLTTAFIASQ
jgi:hypothetical protein